MSVSKRELIVKEILLTEENYVSSLDLMEELYFKPLKEILSPKDHAAVFRGILGLRDLNRRFQNSLKETVDSWTESSKIGDVFAEYTPFFKMYITYVNNHETNRTLMSNLRRHPQYASFREFESKQRKDPRLKNNTRLADFLIAPVQRIPHYKLLLERLLNHTPSDHDDYGEILLQLDKIDQVGVAINESIHSSENRRKIRQIQRQIEGNVKLVAPHRRFILAGRLVLRPAKVERKDKVYKFFLFNDLLAWARPKRLKSGKYKLVNTITLDSNFEVHRAGRKQGLFCLKLVEDQLTFVVGSPEEREINIWHNSLQRCMAEHKKTIAGKRLHRRRSSLMLAHEHQSKQRSANCTVCLRPFNVFRGKRTCKSCGHIVCNDCSKARMTIEKLKKDVRVCTKCVERIQADLAQERAEMQLSAADRLKVITTSPLKPNNDDELKLPEPDSESVTYSGSGTERSTSVSPNLSLLESETEQMDSEVVLSRETIMRWFEVEDPDDED